MIVGKVDERRTAPKAWANRDLELTTDDGGSERHRDSGAVAACTVYEESSDRRMLMPIGSHALTGFLNRKAWAAYV